MCTGYSTFTGLKEKLGFQQEQEGCEKSEATLLTGAVPAPAIMATPRSPLWPPPGGRVQEPLGRAGWGGSGDASYRRELLPLRD